MTRREALTRGLSTAGSVFILLRTRALAEARAQSVDPDFLRAWNEAQRAKPATIGPKARIAAPDEPGTPLVIQGQIFKADGATPAADVTVFAYQTDNKGIYNEPGQKPDWRLRGWARADRNGRYEFTTIRPAPYPGRAAAGHVHIGIEGTGIPRQTVRDLLFEGDPLLTAQELRESRDAGRFAFIRPVSTRGGIQYVELLSKPDGRFLF